MAWVDVPHHERDQLARTLTDRQLHIYILRLGGYSWTRISEDTGLSIRTVRDHERRARQLHHLIRQEAA